MMKLQVKDRVVIIDDFGYPVAEGTIVNINDFRERKYAVDVDGYEDDVLFCDEAQLILNN